MELSIELVKLLLDAIAKLEEENKKLKEQLSATQSVKTCKICIEKGMQECKGECGNKTTSFDKINGDGC